MTTTRYQGHETRGLPYAPVASRQSIRQAAFSDQFPAAPPFNLPNPAFLSSLPDVSWANFAPGQGRLSQIVRNIEQENREVADDVRSILRLTEEYFLQQLMPQQSQEPQQLLHQPSVSPGPTPTLFPQNSRQHSITLFAGNQPPFPASEDTSRRSSIQEASWQSRAHFEQFSGTFTDSEPHTALQPFLSAPPQPGPSLQVNLYREQHYSSSQSNLSQNVRVETPGSSTGFSEGGSGQRRRLHGPVRRGSQLRTSPLRDYPLTPQTQTPTPTIREPIPSIGPTSNRHSPNSNQTVHPNASTPAEPDPEVWVTSPTPTSPFGDQGRFYDSQL